MVVDQDDDRRREWLAQLAEIAPAAASARHAEREVIREIAQRLGSVEDLGFPYAREALAQTSTAWLERTSDLANVLLGRHEEFAGLIGHLVARDVPGAWPTRVSVRWLADQFRGTPLLEGLSLDMGPLPKTLGAASFVRALARFGAAYARVAVIAPGRAFAFTHEPWGAHPLRRGALFGSLVANPAFLQKQLGFSKDDARRTGRALAATLLAQTRLDAAQSLLDLASASAAAGQEAVEYALKVRVAEGLSAVLPKPAVLAPVRFAALCSPWAIAKTCATDSTTIGFATRARSFRYATSTQRRRRSSRRPKNRLPERSTGWLATSKSSRAEPRGARTRLASRGLGSRRLRSRSVAAAAAANPGRFEEVLQVDDDRRHRRVAVVAERVPYREVDREHCLDVAETG